MKLRHKILFHGFGAFAIVKTAILLFGFFAGIHGVGGVNASSIGSYNGQFLDSGFWNNYTMDCSYDGDCYGPDDLKKILYAPESAYVQNWSGYSENPCDIEDIQVEEVTELPENLEGNKIYVLKGNAVLNAQSENTISVDADCSAIVSKGMFRIFMNHEVSQVQSLFNVGGSNFILDNLKIEKGAMGNIWYGLYIKNAKNFTVNNAYFSGFQEGRNTKKGAGIYCENSSSYGLFQNLKMSGNDWGMRMDGSYIMIRDSEFFYNGKLGVGGKLSNSIVSNCAIHDNEGLGLLLENGANNNQIYNLDIYNVPGDSDTQGAVVSVRSNQNLLSNILVYNSQIYGVEIGGTKNALNNVQVFNHTKGGISVQNDSNLFNNVFVYNLFDDGIILASRVDKNIFNNVWVFNTKRGISNANVDARFLYYYCSGLYLFDNTNGTESILRSDDCSGFGSILTNGNVFGGKVSWDYITNPKRAFEDKTKSGYMLNWRSNFTGIVGYQADYTGETIGYSFGSGIVRQVQPLMWSGDEIAVADLPYDPNKYIGSTDTDYATGVVTKLNTKNAVVSKGSDFLTHYSVFGENMPWIFNVGIGEEATLNWGNITNYYNKRLVFQIKERAGNSDTYFATHFQKNLNVPDCLLGWNNDNFLDSRFWTGYDGDTDLGHQQVICALYGRDELDKTAYTIGWSGWDTTQCSGVNMTVIETGTLPTTLSRNTIYVLTTGKVINSDTINMATCSAIVSKSGSILYTENSVNDVISFLSSIEWFVSDDKYCIMDNIAVDGTNNGNGGTHETNTRGIYLHYSNNNTLNNIKSYNNKNGIYLQSSDTNVLNNILTYNQFDGYSNGLVLQGANKNTLNNIQAYNNSKGIYLYSSSNYNILNNIQVYNNGFGFELYNANYNEFNNLRSYNNSRGYWYQSEGDSSIDNKYYGKLNVFGNASYNGVPGNLQRGGGERFLIGWSSGELSTGGMLTWNLFTNPKDVNDNYLLDWSTGFNNLRGNKTIIGEISGYSYGVDIKTQAQPVVWSGDTLITGGSYNPNYYIGSNVQRVTGSLAYDQIKAEGTQIVTGTSSSNLVTYYKIFGDVEDTSYVTKGSSLEITYVLEKEDKYLITQLINPGIYFATHFQNVASSTMCIFEMEDESAVCTSGSIRLKVSMLSGVADTFDIKLGNNTYSGNLTLQDGSGYIDVDNVGTYTAVVKKSGVEVLCEGEVEITNQKLDKQGPTVELEFTGYECTTITGIIDSGTLIDPGCSSGGEISCDWVEWMTGLRQGVKTGIIVPVELTDSLGNMEVSNVTFRWIDNPVTGQDFTVGNVGTGITIVDWMSSTYGDVHAGDCETVSGVVSSNGTKGTCVISGIDLIYTPNPGQTGSDTCTLTIDDGDGTGTIVVTFYGIDRKGPVVTLSAGSGCTGNFEQYVTVSTDEGVLSGYMFSGVKIDIPGCFVPNIPYCIPNPSATNTLYLNLLGGTGKIWVDTGAILDDYGNQNDRVELEIWNYDGTPLSAPELKSPGNGENLVDSGITFEWSGVIDDGCAGVSGYILRYWTGGIGNVDKSIVILLGNDETQKLQEITEVGDYWRKVTAVDNFGRETDSQINKFTFNPAAPTCTITQSACTAGNVLLTLSWSGDNIEIINSGEIDWIGGGKLWTGYVSGNANYEVQIINTDFGTTGSCKVEVTGHDVYSPIINSMTTGVYECTDLNFVVEAEDEGCAGISGYLFSSTLFGAINTGNSRFIVNSGSVGRTGGEVEIDIIISDTLGNQIISGALVKIWDIKPEIQHNINLQVLTGNVEISLSEVISRFGAEEGVCGTADLSLTVDGTDVYCEIEGENLHIKVVDNPNGGECVIKISDNEGSFATGKITYGADTNTPEISLIGTNLACMDTDNFVVTGQFTESVNGFTSVGINVINGTINNFGGNGNVYTWTVMMEPMKEVQIQISGGVASNVNGNPNAESNILTGMYDNAGPNDVVFTNWQNTRFATYATLSWDPTEDRGCAGVSGYNYKFVEGTDCDSNSVYAGFMTGNTIDVNNLLDENIYALCVQPVDKFGNVGQWTSKAFTVNLNSIGCEIVESACSNTGVVLTLSPSQGIGGASLSWIGYGQQPAINKVVTSFGEIVTGYIWQDSEQGLKQAICTYSVKNIDKREPIVNQLFPVSVLECTTGTATIAATDQGCGSGDLMYNWNGLGFGVDTNYSLYSGNAGSKTVNVQVRDGARNITGIIVVFEWTNSPISGHNFTGSENVGNTQKTANWKILSEVSDGLCGNATISYSGIVVPGQHGTCTVNGDIITYTPNTNVEYEGEDSCTIQVRDDENSTMNIAVYRGGIDTKAPSITVNNALGYECEWISGSIGLNSVNKETGVSYRWNNETIFVTGENSYHQINYTVGIRNIPVVVRDIYGNEITTGVTYRWNDTGVTLNSSVVNGPSVTKDTLFNQSIFDVFGAKEGSCGTDHMTASVVSCSGVSMVISGNTYRVTPIDDFEGTGQCVISFADDDGNSQLGTIIFGIHTGKPRLYLTVQVDKIVVNVDENVKYTVCYGNTGNVAAENVSISVDLPFLFVGNINSWMGSGGSYNSLFHSVDWTLPAIAPNQTGCLNYLVGKYTKEGFYVAIATLDGSNVQPSLASSATVEVLRKPYCGDGIVGDNEVCDDGKNNGKKGYCNEDCDGYVKSDTDDDDKEGVACKYGDENYISRGAFTDTYGHWGFEYIENMRLSCLHRGKMTFAGLWQYWPDDQTTRAEVLKTLVKIRGIAKDDFDINTEDAVYPGAQIFVDVPRNYWFAWYTEYAYNNGLMDELYATIGGQKYFVPEGAISRNEIIKKVMILYNDLNGISSPDSEISGTSKLTDVSTSSPYYKYIREAESLGIISGVDNLSGGNQWQGSRSLTRAEFAKMISKAFEDILFE